MFNMDKITRTKLAMLVTGVLLTIFTTIGLYYTMTVSNVMNIGNGDPLVLNFSMVLAIMIAFMWMVLLILFYEFKTDDALKSELHKYESETLKLNVQVKELEEFKATLKATTFRPDVFDSDVLYAGVPKEELDKIKSPVAKSDVTEFG
jgi:hypothetical protein